MPKPICLLGGFPSIFPLLTILGVIVAGSCNARAGGDLDLPFGTNGITLLDWETQEELHAMALQADGKIVLAGNSTKKFTSDFTLTRFHPDGRPDLAFGTGGRVTADFAVDDYDGALCVVVQPDGKILAAGHQSAVINTIGYAYIVLARFNEDGSPDSGFGIQGRVVTDIPGRFSEAARTVVLQPDGKIVVGASSGTGDIINYTLLRYAPAGSLDSTFGTGGIRSTTFRGAPRAMALQPDGKILLAGDANLSYDTGEFALTRFLPDGKTDTAFGSAGRVLTDFGAADTPTGMVLGSDGKILVAGNRVVNFKAEPCLARFHPNGSLDTSFGQAGKTTLSLTDRSLSIQGMAMRGDGRIVLAGTKFLYSLNHAAVVGLLADGAPDPGFGTGGLVDIGNGSQYSYSAGAVAVQADGRVVVAGQSMYFSSYRDFLLMRFSNAPSPGVVAIGASELTISSAKLRALVNAGGAATTVGFEYREQGQSAFLPLTPTPSTVTGMLETPVEMTLAGLKRNTFYSYRATGINSSAAVTGNEPRFKTLSFHEVWREKHFGTYLNAGDGADGNDYDHDGLINLMEWALAQDPKVRNDPPYSLSITQAGLEFTHPRNLSALEDGFVFTTEWTLDPAGPWSGSGVTDTVESESVGSRIVKSTIPVGTEGRCFVRLRLVAP